MELIHTMILVAAGLLAYSYLAARLSKTIQPLRLKVAEDIESLIADQSIDGVTRADLDRLGDSLFSSFSAWMLVLTYPVGVFYALCADRDVRADSNKSHPRRKDISYTYASGIFCMVASSPLCLLIFAVEIFLLMIVFAPLGRAGRKALHIVFSIEDSRHVKVSG